MVPTEQAWLAVRAWVFGPEHCEEKAAEVPSALQLQWLKLHQKWLLSPQ